MEFRIGFKINFDLLQTSIAFSFKRKVKGNRKVRKKETKEEQLQIKLYSTQTEFRIDLNLFFDLIQNSIAFSHLVWFNSTALGPGRKKTNCLQKATVQWPWTTNDMATARNVGTAGWIFFINFAHRVKVHNNMFLVYTKFNALSYGYWGPYRFTWFGILSGHTWTLPY